MGAQKGREWMMSEVRYIKQNCETMTAHEMAEHLDRPLNTVRSYIYRFRDKFTTDRKVEIEKFVRDNLDTMKYGEMAKHLDISYPVVANIASRFKSERAHTD